MKKFISDSNLTEEQFVNKYSSMEEFGNSAEMILYLKLKHRWMLNVPGVTWLDIINAYNNTHLKNR